MQSLNKLRSYEMPVASNLDPTSDNPELWSKVAKIIRDNDEEKIKDCKEDIDNLLVFVRTSCICGLNGVSYRFVRLASSLQS